MAACMPSCAQVYLCICGVLKGIKDLFQCNRLATLFVNSFPDNTIGLQAQTVCSQPHLGLSQVSAGRRYHEAADCHCCLKLTPFPSLDSMSYLRRICLSISSVISCAKRLLQRVPQMHYHTATDALIIADKADNTLFAVQVHGDRRRHSAERGCLVTQGNTDQNADGCCSEMR